MTTSANGRGDVRPPAIFADELSTLVAFLDYLRDSVIAKIDGLDEAEARSSPVPTGTSLLQLIKHLAITEQNWLRKYFLGEALQFTAQDNQLSPGDTMESVVDLYRTTAKQSNEILSRESDLNAPAKRAHPNYVGNPTLRWVLVHLVEETARHAGHADILRELIDGVTGR